MRTCSKCATAATWFYYLSCVPNLMIIGNDKAKKKDHEKHCKTVLGYRQCNDKCLHLVSIWHTLNNFIFIYVIIFFSLLFFYNFYFISSFSLSCLSVPSKSQLPNPFIFKSLNFECIMHVRDFVCRLNTVEICVVMILRLITNMSHIFLPTLLKFKDLGLPETCQLRPLNTFTVNQKFIWIVLYFFKTKTKALCLQDSIWPPIQLQSNETWIMLKIFSTTHF